MEFFKKSSEITIRGTEYFYEFSSDSDSLFLAFEEKTSSKK